MTGQTNLHASSREILQKYAHTLNRLQFISREPGSSPGMGRHQGSAAGYSVEFADYRKYDYGDDIRYIDWSIYARLRKLFLRQFKAEAEMAIHILLDTSNSMNYGNSPKMQFAKKLAALFSYVGLNKHDRVGVTTFSDRLHTMLPPKRGRHQLSFLLELIDTAPSGGKSEFEKAFRDYAARSSTRGILVVLSDCFCADDYKNAFRCLAFSGFDVVVVRVLAREELQPELEEGMELRDLEQGEMHGPLVTDSAVARYRQRMDDYSGVLSSFCLGEGFPFVETVSSLSFDEIMVRMLRSGIWTKH